MESLVQEIRYSIRSLATRPLVAVVAVCLGSRQLAFGS